MPGKKNKAVVMFEVLLSDAPFLNRLYKYSPFLKLIALHPPSQSRIDKKIGILAVLEQNIRE